MQMLDANERQRLAEELRKQIALAYLGPVP